MSTRRAAALELKKKSLPGGHSAIVYGMDTDGVQRAFVLRIDATAFNSFPRDLVTDGKLDDYVVRADWAADQKISYFDGKKILDAVFFRHCK